MKSNQNSKHQNHTQNPPSYKSNFQTLISKFPSDHSSPSVNLSNKKISSLIGLNQYKNLIFLNLENNLIDDYESLKPLRNCEKLQKVCLKNNPICQRVNYRYGVYLVIDGVVEIDGVGVGDLGWGVVQGWQRENGYKVIGFFMQCCAIIDSLIKKQRRHNIPQLKKQLQNLKSTFLAPKKDAQNFLISTNQSIQRCLPLRCVQSMEPSQLQASQLTEYLIQKLLQPRPSESPESGNKFLQKILGSIEVADEEEQKQLSIKVQVTKIIMRDVVIRESLLLRELENQTGKGDSKGDASVKHFTSAETALETVDTVGRQRVANTNWVHFCLDIQYLNELCSVIVNEINRLQQVLQHELTQFPQQLQIKTIKLKPPKQNTYQDQVTTHLQTSPAQIYKNPTILQTLINFLQLSMKKIILKKIRKFKNEQYISNIFSLIENSFENNLYCSVLDGFRTIKDHYMREKMILEKMKIKKLGNIFRYWKNIKRRRNALVKKIVNRKVKGDSFMLALVLTKWKINCRADRIKRMASAALLGTRVSSMPKSKKGIDLAYQRTIHNRKIGLR